MHFDPFADFESLWNRQHSVVPNSHQRSVWLKAAESDGLRQNHITPSRARCCCCCWKKLFFSGLFCNTINWWAERGLQSILVDWSPSGYCQDVNKFQNLGGQRLELIIWFLNPVGCHDYKALSKSLGTTLIYVAAVGFYTQTTQPFIFCSLPPFRSQQPVNAPFCRTQLSHPFWPAKSLNQSAQSLNEE